MLNTYLTPVVNWNDNVVHCQYKNWGAVTGRMSSAQPNMQNITKAVVDLFGNSNEEARQAAIEIFRS